MVGFKIMASVLGLGVVGGSIALLITNPKQDAYETYAVAQLKDQLDQEVCQDAPAFLEGTCSSLISSDNNDSFLRTVVSSSTNRRNYFVLSIYETDLDPMTAFEQVLPAGLSVSIGNAEGIPTYHVETVGVLGQFFTYEAQKR